MIHAFMGLLTPNVFRFAVPFWQRYKVTNCYKVYLSFPLDNLS